MQYILCLSDFFTPSKEGSINGICIVCGRKTDRGLKVDFSDNFTNWNLLQVGDCICPQCYELARNQVYRRKSWIATKEGITFIQRKDFLNVLLSPPDPPFGIYLTRTYQKQGFFLIINHVNYSRKKFFVAFDDQLLTIDRKKLQEMTTIARELRAHKVKKEELRTGIFSPNTYARVSLDLLEKARNFAGDPIWELVVYAVE